MPLTICPECSENVSTAAISCPHCGYQAPPAKGAEYVLWFMCLGGAIIPGAIIWSILGGVGGTLGMVVIVGALTAFLIWTVSLLQRNPIGTLPQPEKVKDWAVTAIPIAVAIAIVAFFIYAKIKHP